MKGTERIQRILEEMSLLNLYKLAQSDDEDLATLSGEIYGVEMDIRGKWYTLQYKLAVMEKKEREEKTKDALDKIRELHDTIKNHPYFDNFNPSMATEVFSMIRKMEDVFFSSPLWDYEESDNLVHYSTPQAALICDMSHNINESMTIVSCWRGEIGSYIAQIHSFISLFHSLIEGKEQTTAWINMDNYKNDYKYKVLRAVYIKDKGWHRTVELKRENKKEEMIKWEEVISKQVKGLRSVNVVASALRCLDDLDKESNKYYTIVD